MPLIKDGALADDPFVELDDEAPLPAGAPVIVSSARWAEDREALLAHDAALALVLRNDEAVDDVADDLRHFAAVVVEFPTFSDGRGFSQARHLREQCGYEGEVRARGHIIRDQYLFLHRVGVNAIEVADENALEQWNKAMEEFSLFYQRTIDQRTPLMSLRNRSDKAAS